MRPLIRLALGAAALAGLVFALNPGDLGTYFQSVDPANFVLAALLYTTSYLARGLRWHFLLNPLTGARSAGVSPARAGARSWLDTCCISTLGWSLNNILPFKLGDLLRLYLMQQRAALSPAALLSSAVVERLLDIALLLGTVAIGLTITGTQRLIGIPTSAFTILAAAMTGMLALYLLATRTSLIPARLRTQAEEYRRAVRAYLTPGTLAIALALTIAAWCLQAAQYAVFFDAFEVALDPQLFAIAFAAFMLSFAVAVVPGQLGTYELFFVAIFTATGIVRPEAALAIGLAIHAVNAVLLSALGLLSYLKLGMPAEGIRSAWRHRHHPR